MSTSLMASRRFAPLFWCQFFSAFNDNFLKNALVFLILFKIGGQDAEALITLAGAVFIAPFFFLSGLGGQLADRFDKAVVARRLKLAEIWVTALASAGFALHSLPALFAALFLFGVIAALFGPIKYGILPDHLAREELPAGNALVESATFMAILLGTIAGGLASKGNGGPASFSALIMLFALLCWGAALMIPHTGKAAPTLPIDRNIIRSTGTLLKELWSDARLRWGGVVLSWFWARRRGDSVAPAPLGEDRARRRRGGGHRLPRHFLHRDRRRLGPRVMARARAHHPSANRRRRVSSRGFRTRSRLGGARRGARRDSGRHRRRPVLGSWLADRG